jgi:hypothetical protein
MKTSELEGALLDYWVARAEGLDAELSDGVCFIPRTGVIFRASTNWAQGGPIIERERIEINPRSDRGYWEWCAVPLLNDAEWWERFQYGITPLVAAMRAYVASKFGDEVADE